MAQLVVEPEADQRALRAGIVQGRLLAEEVRQEHEAAGPRRQVACLVIQPGMRRLPDGPRGFGGRLPELRHDPVQNASARGHAAVADVEPRHDVEVDEHARVSHRTLTCEHDVPGTPNLTTRSP